MHTTHKHHRIPQRGGFTLVELLVVIAIVALLLSILLPAISKAQDLAKAAVCGQNAKQIATAFTIFVGENNETLTSHLTDGTTNTTGFQWIVSLSEQVEGNEKVFLCPVAKKPRNEGGVWWKQGDKDTWGTATHAWTLVQSQYNKLPDSKKKPSGEPEVKYWGSYGYNRWLTDETKINSAQVGTPHGNYYKSLMRVEHTSSTPMFAECAARTTIVKETDPLPEDYDDPLNVLSGSAATGTTKEGIRSHALNRHGGSSKAAINIAFVDNSVRRVSWDVDTENEESFNKAMRLNVLWHARWDNEEVTGGGGGGSGGGGVVF